MPEHLKRIELKIANYEDAQKAAIYGIQDLLTIANSLAAQKSADLPLFEFTQIDTFETTIEKAPGQYEADLAIVVFLPPILKTEIPDQADPQVLAWIQQQHAQGDILCATCAGTFLLAEAGLLDGKKATTHWLLHQVFLQRFQEVQLDTSEMLIDLGTIITSGGIMAWVDMGLNLIGRFHGLDIRRQAARYFVVEPATRVQSPYKAFQPNMQHGDQEILQVQELLNQSVEKSYSLNELADRVKLEKHTFLRRFKKRTGFTPSEYHGRLKVETARNLLESTKKNVDQIAYAIGYSDSGTLRRNFKKQHGISPNEYRKRFQ